MAGPRLFCASRLRAKSRGAATRRRRLTARERPNENDCWRSGVTMMSRTARLARAHGIKAILRSICIAPVAALASSIFVPSVGCGGVDGWCTESGSCYSPDEKACSTMVGCIWGQHCTSIDCGDATVAQSDCAARRGCEWDVGGASCIPSTSALQCGSMADSASCTAQAGCEWLSGCLHDPSVNCNDKSSQSACEAVQKCNWVAFEGTKLG